MRKCIAHFLRNSFRNIGELVPWKQLVEARQTALHASIPWLASCSPCLSVFSTLPTGTHTFMPKNPLTGTIICSKVSLFFFFSFFSYVFIMRFSVEIFSEPQKAKKKANYRGLRKCNHFCYVLIFLFFSWKSLSLARCIFDPKIHMGENTYLLHALQNITQLHGVWKYY